MRGLNVRWMVFGVSALVFAAGLAGQVERYELGRRVRQFERVFAEADPETRAAATVESLKRAVSAFFSLQLATAGSHLMVAERALKPKPGPLQAWADSLFVQPDRRALDAKDTLLPLRIRAFYKLDQDLPADCKVIVRLYPGSSDGAKVSPVAQAEFAVDELPLRGALRLEPKTLSPGDGWQLRCVLAQGDREAALAPTPISFVADLAPRLARLKSAVDGLDTKTTRGATVRALFRVVRSSAGRRTLETDYPVGALLAQAERDLAQPEGAPLRRGAGQHWLTLAAGGRRVPVRIGIPEAALAADKPMPLVLALHGAGGSENMFFDTYGDGEVWRQASARGFVVCAPRQGLTGSPLPALVAELRKIVPLRVDRIFVVGHSMGAGQAVAATCARPSFYRAVAALGGGGRVRPSAALKGLPFFVAAGAEDFGRSGAKRLHRDLLAAGVRASYRDYPDIEHLAIVQVALPRVFEFFETHLKE